ncbi:MAG: Dabb family protein [Pseudomonadota bacterium]
MIRHIVMFSAKRPEDIETIHQGLKLLQGIPAAQCLEVSHNQKTDQLGNEIDVVVYGEFADEKALAEFKAHDLYQQSIGIVRPLRELRVAADYEVP